MRGIILFVLVFLLSFSSVRGESLDELINKIGILSPDEILREIDKLPQEERIKLQVLLLFYAGKDEKAKELLKKLYPKKIVSNVLLLPESTKAIVVDKTREILYVVGINKGVPYIEKKFPCITGKRPGDKLEEGDLRTPEGIYFPLYWRTNLPKMYGIGAYPLNYPNILDRKILKRNGHGIWIHGTDNPNRPPHSTNGCIALRNEYLEELRKIIKPRLTPVIVVSELSYSTKESYIDEQKSLLDFVLRWKKAWEDTPKNIEEYLSLYSKHFVWKNGGYREWIKHKKRVTSQKKWIKINISNISISKDGRLLEFGNIYVVSLDLDYKSNNFNSKGKKLLYVIKEGKQWKILGEESL